MRATRAICLVGCVILGCSGGDTSEGKVLLNIYAAKMADPTHDPFLNVAFFRVQATGAGVDVSKIFVMSAGRKVTLDSIPFGSEIQITLEGYSLDPSTGKVGNLISRGRTLPLDIRKSSDTQVIDVMISLVSQFAFTTAVGPNGSFATPMAMGRVGHTVTVLQDGRVLIVGGATLLPQSGAVFKSPADIDLILDSCEIYDPYTGVFTQLLDENGMKRKRVYHTASLLPDGRVLIAGGITEISGTKQTLAEIQFFDPVENTFSLSAPKEMTVSRAGHTATLIDSVGRVVFGGGYRLATDGSLTTTSSLEVYDPNPAMFDSDSTTCETDPPKCGSIYSTALQHARYFHRAVKVPLGPDNDNAVVFIGGENNDSVLDTAEIFILKPASVDAEAVVMEKGPRTMHTATYVPNQGYIHVVGGFTDKGHSNTTDLIESFDLQLREFRSLQEPLLEGRGGHDAVGLEDNVVLIVGGYNNGNALASAEVIFDYTIPYGNCITVDKLSIPARLCSSCSSDEDCVPTTSRCSHLDVTGNYCTIDCVSDGDCPSEFYCHDLVGAPMSQCVPKGELKSITGGGVGSMASGRSLGVGVFMPNGFVLVTGGIDSTGGLNRMGELFNPL
jgi:hypothetical protein